MRIYISKKSTAAIFLLLSIMVLLVTASAAYKEDIYIPVTNGYGTINLGNYDNPSPCEVAVDVTGRIVNPQNGTWRIRILVNDKSVFNESNIPVNKSFYKTLNVGGNSRSNIQVEAWWTEKANTTMKAKAEGGIGEAPCVKEIGKGVKEIGKSISNLW